MVAVHHQLVERTECAHGRPEILELLGKEDHPVTAKFIHEKLSGACDLVTVYRSLKLLESMSLVKRFNFGDNTARFELISSTDHGHHHHLICKVCRTVVEIDECFDPSLESKIAKKHPQEPQEPPKIKVLA